MLKLEQDLRLGLMVLRLCCDYKTVYKYWQIIWPGQTHARRVHGGDLKGAIA
jgi:hypothetical protein